jgi:DNA ligase (NAD+)
LTDLAQRLRDAAEAYYNGTPILSDAAFDALRDELARIDPAHPFLKQVGAPVSSGWQKVRHTIPMGSQFKAQTPDDMASWMSNIPGRPALCVTEKLDGISLALTYQQGSLTVGATRGDGETGEDITRNVRLMKGAVQQLPSVWPDGTPCPETVQVRAEIIVRLDDFAQFFQGDSNPRNSASGKAKSQKDNIKCKYLTVVAYQIMVDGQALDTKEQELQTLRQLGFLAVSYEVVPDLQGASKVYDRYVQTDRAALNHEIDGLIVEINDRDLRESRGVTDGRPKGAIAWKFPHDIRPTILRAIHWQTAATGRITPVAEFDTVILGGANVSRATLHNISYITDLALGVHRSGLSEGDKILVSKRNDVIPGVEEVLEANPNGTMFDVPTVCPRCKGPTERNGEYLVCTNREECPAQVAGAITRWISKIGVKHFGKELVYLLCECEKVKTIADIYHLTEEEVAILDMGGRRVGGAAGKALKNLHAKKDLPLHVFIGSLGIPNIGRTTAQAIVDAGFDSLKKLQHATPSQIAAIPGVGQITADAFCDGYWDLLDQGLIAGILGGGVTIQKKKGGPMAGQSFCMTGFRDAEMVQAIERAGGTVKDGVSRDLTVLVVKDPGSTSGKAQKARQYGVEVLGIDEMWDRLGGKP